MEVGTEPGRFTPHAQTSVAPSTGGISVTAASEYAGPATDDSDSYSSAADRRHSSASEPTPVISVAPADSTPTRAAAESGVRNLTMCI